MLEKVELTRRTSYNCVALTNAVPYTMTDPRYPRIVPLTEPYEYILRVGDNCSRIVEDGYMIDMRLSTTVAQYNRYIVDRLTHQMMDFIGDGIKKALNEQAAKNSPSHDNMAYLFKG